MSSFLQQDSIVARRSRFFKLVRIVLWLWLLIAVGGVIRVALAISNKEIWTGAENKSLTNADLGQGLAIFLAMALIAAVLLVLLRRWAKRTA